MNHRKYNTPLKLFYIPIRIEFQKKNFFIAYLFFFTGNLENSTWYHEIVPENDIFNHIYLCVSNFVSVPFIQCVDYITNATLCGDSKCGSKYRNHEKSTTDSNG